MRVTVLNVGFVLALGGMLTPPPGVNAQQNALLQPQDHMLEGLRDEKLIEPREPQGGYGSSPPTFTFPEGYGPPTSVEAETSSESIACMWWKNPLFRLQN